MKNQSVRGRQKARTFAPEFKQLYYVRIEKFHEERAKILKDKEISLQQMRESPLKKKEQLASDIMTYGLWQSEHDMTLGRRY